MKKILVFIIMIGVLFLAGCPDGAYLGAMYLDADLGPYKVDEIVPMFGFQWDFNKENTGSPHSNSALTRVVSSDGGGLSK